NSSQSDLPANGKRSQRCDFLVRADSLGRRGLPEARRARRSLPSAALGKSASPDDGARAARQFSPPFLQESRCLGTTSLCVSSRSDWQCGAPPPLPPALGKSWSVPPPGRC